MKIILSLLGKVVNQKGGMEKVLCNMANNLVQRGHEICVTTYEKSDGIPFFELDSRVKYINLGKGLKENRLYVNLLCAFTRERHKREYYRQLYSAKLAAKEVTKLLAMENPDIIVAFDRKSVIVYNEILKTKIPVVSMFHFNPEVVLANPYFDDYYKKPCCIQVLIKSDVEKVRRKLGIDNVVCIPNAVPQYSDSAELKSKVIINVARIDSKSKRQKVIIEAMALLKNRHPDWTVQFWGDISFDKLYYEELVSLIRQEDLQDRVKFCGISNEIKDKLKEASIFAFPSAHEGFPLALSEAMSIGLPAVGFKNAPAVNELIIDECNGLLADDSVEDYANCLDRLMSDDKLREKLGKQAKLDMVDYSDAKVWDSWENLLKNVIDKCCLYPKIL